MHFVNRRLDPMEADVRIVDGAVTGRLMGPRNHYASTVEVAYYVRPAPDGGQRVVIPEPSFWEPATPFLYEAILETADGTKVKRRHGLRTVRLTPAGLRVNRKPFVVDGVARNDLGDAAALRAAGVNTILCRLSRATAHLWDEADVLGFLVLGEVADVDAVALARELKDRACSFGWIVADESLIEPEALQTLPGQEPLLGLRAETSRTNVPPWVQFFAGRVEGSDLPWLAIDEGTNAAPGTMGVIRR